MSARIIKLSMVVPEAKPFIPGTPTPEKKASDAIRAELNVLEQRAQTIRQEIKNSQGMAKRILDEATEKAESVGKKANAIWEQAKAQAEDLEKKAQEKAEAIIKKAQEETEEEKKNVLAKAREKGEQEGLKKGQEKMDREIERILTELEKKLENGKKARRESLIAAQKDILELALAISKRIIKEESQLNPEIIMGNIEEAVKRINDKENIAFVISPKDLEVVEKNKEIIIQKVAGLKYIRILEDPNIERGGLVIETNYGTIDATLSSMTAQLEKTIRHEAGIDG